MKSWPFTARKTPAKGEPPRAIGVFECPNCKARFRAALEVETKIEETANIKTMVEKIKGIQGELVQTLRNLREKIKTLETERASLMVEIEKLREAGESKVEALEGEVSILREEVKSLRELLGQSKETGDSKI
jgi:predicted  nucleic acid-binding Zn-ribbon protein